MSLGGNKSKRWWIWQFSLRSLFLWAVVVALGCGWLSSEARRQKLRFQLDVEVTLRKQTELNLEMLSQRLNDIYDSSDAETKQKMMAIRNKELR